MVGITFAAVLLRFLRAFMMGLAALLGLILVVQTLFLAMPLNTDMLRGTAIIVALGLGCGIIARLFEQSR
jgi:hypothetical protein